MNKMSMVISCALKLYTQKILPMILYALLSICSFIATIEHPPRIRVNIRVRVMYIKLNLVLTELII